MKTRYVVGYVVTDVKSDDKDVSDFNYDVTVDVVKKWRLTNLPIRWQHLMPGKSKHSCTILSERGIGKVVNWWFDFSPKWNPFAVAVLLEINDPDVLSSPVINQYRCISLSYLASDHTQCVEISLVRTGQRNLTAGQYVPRKMLDKVCSEAFGFPKNQYKRRQTLSNCMHEMEGSDKNCSDGATPEVLQPNKDGQAANASELAEVARSNVDEEPVGPVNRLLKEAETVQAILEKIPSKDGESLMQLIEDRDNRLDEVEQKLNRRLETWSVQLRDLLNRFSDSIDGRCDPEIKKRKEDVDKLNGQLDGISDVWKRMELISASFETVSQTLSSTHHPDKENRKNIVHLIRSKWPANVKVTVRDSDEMMDQFADAIKKNEVLETKRLNSKLDGYYNRLHRNLERAAGTAEPRNGLNGLNQDEIQWVRHFKRKREDTNRDDEGAKTNDATKRNKVEENKETVRAGFVDRHSEPTTSMQATHSKGDDLKTFNYWTDRKNM